MHKYTFTVFTVCRLSVAMDNLSAWHYPIHQWNGTSRGPPPSWYYLGGVLFSAQTWCQCVLYWYKCSCGQDRVNEQILHRATGSNCIPTKWAVLIDTTWVFHNKLAPQCTGFSVYFFALMLLFIYMPAMLCKLKRPTHFMQISVY